MGYLCLWNWSIGPWILRVIFSLSICVCLSNLGTLVENVGRCKGGLLLQLLGLTSWKLNFTPSLLQAENQIVLGWQPQGGWSHAIACLFAPLQEAEGRSPCMEPSSFHSSCSATRLLLLMYHSITASCQALLEAPEILQGAQQTTALLSWDLYFIRKIESINNKQGG